MGITEPPATSLTDICTPINRINGVRKEFRRANLDTEEKLEFLRPLFLRKKEMQVSVSDPPIRGNLVNFTWAGHLRRVWLKCLVGSGGPIKQPNIPFHPVQQAIWRPRPRPIAISLQTSTD
ncbi:hypothetical protein CRG98_033401 [Punica granatum]|uniref:Uncharacterized protein n=1 Tax=Punica granatum TaxID=22663 RepID=A0A2I0IQD4_PUNGR|nr:hypothetical protein CRG98_033401 [Punica granatum]